jgi:hypothetical protein
MTLKLKGSTDGSVSLQAPADTVPTGTDKTLILPTGIGSANQYLKNSATPGTLEFGTLPATGKILQVKNLIFTGNDEFTNTSFANVTNFSQTLATSSSTNKVLIILNITLYTNTTTNAASARITYDGNSTREIQRQYTSASGIPGTISFMSLVSPGKTDSITYQVQVKSDFASHTYNLNKDFNGDNTSHSELILMEVAA